MGFYIIFILCISFIFINCDYYTSTIQVRCDDYCRKISHNGEALASDTYNPDLHYSFQTFTLNLKFGDTIEFYIQNKDYGNMGIYANIPLYELNFGTIDTRYWKGIKVDPIEKTTDTSISSYNFIKNLNAGETDTMTVTIPEYIQSIDYFLYSIKGNSNTFVIQPINHINVYLEGDYELFITFLTLPDKGLLKNVDHSNGQISAIAINTRYSFMQNNIIFEYTDSIINTYTNAHYYISNSTSRLSNEGTMTIVICNYEGTEKCEYKSNFHDTNIYYESCNEGYHFYLYEHNYCIPDEKKNNTYLDKTEDPPIYKTCMTRCSSCDINSELYFNNCNECSSSYFPLEALPVNCVQPSEVDSSFSEVNGKYQTTNKYVFKDTSDVYHSTNDCWYSSSPFIYDGLKFCVDDCSKSNRNAHNGVCMTKCPYNYVSISNVCVEKSMTEDPENGYHITNESKEYLINNMRYNVMLYKQIGNNFKGEDFIMQVYSMNSQPIYSKNISHIDFNSLFDNITRRLSQNSDDIIVVKMDIERAQSVSNQVEYSLYSRTSSSPIYYRIDLSSLSGTSLDISYPIISPLSINTTLASQLSESGYDILNSSSPFYTDSCYPFSIGSSDIIVRDRREYIYKDIELCEEGCTFKYIDYMTDSIVCSCPIKMAMSYTKTNPIRIGNTMEKKNTSDYEFFFCFKTFFKWSTIKNNYGFLSYISILLIESIVVIMFCFERHRLIEKIAMEVNRTATQTEEIKKVSNIYILVKTKKGDKRTSQKLTDNSCRGLIVATTTTKQDEAIKESPKEEVTEQDDDSVDIKSLSDNPGLIFCYIIRRKVSLINIISSSQKYSLITMKISIYLFRVAVNCFLNALLYNEKIISEKFHNNGKESLLTILSIVLCSNVMSHFFVIVINMFFSVEKFLFVFNEQIAMLNPSFMKHQSAISSYITTKFVFISILMILSLIFFLYYITLYCYIYSHSQTQWLINCAYSASFSFGYTVCISIFFTMLFSITNMRNSSSINSLLIFIFWVL